MDHKSGSIHAPEPQLVDSCIHPQHERLSLFVLQDITRKKERFRRFEVLKYRLLHKKIIPKETQYKILCLFNTCKITCVNPSQNIAGLKICKIHYWHMFCILPANQPGYFSHFAQKRAKYGLSWVGLSTSPSKLLLENNIFVWIGWKDWHKTASPHFLLVHNSCSNIVLDPLWNCCHRFFVLCQLLGIIITTKLSHKFVVVFL